MDVLNGVTVEPIAFLYMFATFGEYTCAQDLLFVDNCIHYFGTNECHIDKSDRTSDALSVIESQSGQQLLYYNSILAVTSIFSSFISGSYGDSYGRVVPLSVPPLLSFIVECLFIVSSIRLSPHNHILPLMYVCALLSGLSGGSASFLANCFGFVSDKSHPNQRTKRLVILEANIFCGGFIGYISTGFILKTFTSYKYIICFALYSVIHSFILIYNSLRLRFVETSITQTDGPVIGQQMGPKIILQMFAKVVRTVLKKRPSNNRKIIFLSIICFVLVTYGTQVLTSLLYLYVRNDPLFWDTSTYAFYNGLKFAATGLALCLLPLVQHFLISDICDTSIAIIGVLSRTIGLIAIGLVTDSYVMFGSIILLTFCEYPLPAIRSILSKLVDTTERGKVFAFLTLFHNLCSLSGSIIYPIVYTNAIKTDSYSGLAFQITAALQVMAIFIFIYIRFQLKSSHFVQTINESNDSSDETNRILDDNNDGEGEDRLNSVQT